MNVFEIIDFFYNDSPELKTILLKHSEQVGRKALQILEKSSCKLDKNEVMNGALLHDIGIFKCHAPSILCNGEVDYIAHGIIGAELLRQYGRENNIDLEIYARIAERHTGSGLTGEDIKKQNMPLPPQDFLPETQLEKLICLADKFFSKSGNMQEKSLDSIRRSMAKFGENSLIRFDKLCELFKL